MVNIVYYKYDHFVIHSFIPLNVIHSRVLNQSIIPNPQFNSIQFSHPCFTATHSWVLLQIQSLKLLEALPVMFSKMFLIYPITFQNYQYVVVLILLFILFSYAPLKHASSLLTINITVFNTYVIITIIIHLFIFLRCSLVLYIYNNFCYLVLRRLILIHYKTILLIQ